MVKKSFRTRPTYNTTEALTPIVRLWILRILHPLGGLQRVGAKPRFSLR